MTRHARLLRSILLAAAGAGVWACSADDESCGSCGAEGDRSESGGDDAGGDGDKVGGAPGVGGAGNKSCTNPELIPESGGLVSCDEGYVHRVAGYECPNRLPRDETVEWPDVILQGGAGGAGGGAAVSYATSTDECSSDLDCGKGEQCEVVLTSSSSTLLSDCAPPPYGEQPPTLYYARVCSEPGCVSDDDCADDHVCVCGEFSGRCERISAIAGCRTDDDCEGEALCVRNARIPGFDPTLTPTAQFACQLDADECGSDEDCLGGYYCSLQSEEGRTCQQRAVCGRPFLVHEQVRLAPRARCEGWAGELDRVELPEDSGLREFLERHFVRIGLMEHASIAAFARFTLQLLGMGAPATLVEGSNAAQVDETRHARLAFGLASMYGGQPVGPGPLPLDGVFDDHSFEGILVGTIREGCIGETRAALEAAWAADRCVDPVVREVLRGIAEDEGRHAELAWRVVAWMLGQRPELIQLARETLFAEMNAEPSHPDGRDDASAWGVLSSVELASCWREAREGVIGPCAEQLLGVVAVGIREQKKPPVEGRSFSVDSKLHHPSRRSSRSLGMTIDAGTVPIGVPAQLPGGGGASGAGASCSSSPPAGE